jgi:hypothetical protein
MYSATIAESDLGIDVKLDTDDLKSNHLLSILKYLLSTFVSSQSELFLYRGG